MNRLVHRLKRLQRQVSDRRLDMCTCGPRPIEYRNEGEPMPPERRCEQCGKAQETIVIVWTKNGPWNVERRAEDDFSPQSLARRT